MTVEETETVTWTEPGETIECVVDLQEFRDRESGEITLEVEIEDVLEAFEARRVLVGSVSEIVEAEPELDEEARNSVLHPTYLVEETTRVETDDEDWPDEVAELVREPITVQDEPGRRRSVFVDNVGVSVGDLVDLVRGELQLEQLVAVFRAVGELFEQLHDQDWVHLGLTPWNVRVFDEASEDGFPRHFLTADDEDESPEVPGEDEDPEEDDDSPGPDETIQEGDGNPFSAGHDRTVVELDPLGGSDEIGEVEDGEADDGPDGTESDATDPLGPDDDEFGSDLLVEDTTPVEEVDQEVELQAILDGIDRLYPSGEVDDEIAVTPGFSAPELLSGMGSEDGESADIFSLGMFLYFLVAGVVPPASVYTRHAPAIPARNFRPHFPPGLQSVISRATRPDPEERFASIETMMEAFEDACGTIRRRRRVTPETAPTMDVASDTHIGIAKKERNPTNQDSVFSATSEDEKFALIVVGDGVSTASYGSGDLASQALTEAASEVWQEVLPAYLMDDEIDEVGIIRQILNRANDEIVDYVNEHHTPFEGSPHEVMGSTALVALVVDGEVTLASLGDSRVYLQRGAGMEQITIDHNLWTLSILEGADADSALAMPHGDALARCLGTFTIEEGRLEAVEPQPDFFQFQVTTGDTLLLTTDGLVDFAGTNLLAAEDNILSVLLAEPDPALACLEFILLANRGGGGDNIGLSVARFH